ncbi:DUF927 domain-containing protein [Pseudoalteromonas sp. APC 3218]|uniref:DUF927 domain-containing protein n=1 Tax=Pseudoalteromonas sp. APC 3218 TaxID=3035180 RepID=UPI0025B32FA7|nr:DUF927 domain-containing protein [Pseudoalteromonas sp. APC 3218]MDN3406826.1 DUF927 domain-containing protein [Pseudoalteromonas sp. APC 3218]
MFELRDSGLFYSPTTDSEPRFLCGPIQVLGIARGGNSTRDYGLLVEWKNLDGICIRKLIPRRHIINDQGKVLKELLVDTGLELSSRKGIWDPIISYLIQARPEKRYKSATQTGWLNNSFVTPSWCISNGDEQVIYSGTKEADFLSSAGTLSSWQKEVGSLCINNPLLAFTVCTGLCAPLLHWLNWPSCGVHLFGKSKASKTTTLIMAASLYSGTDFYYAWRSTANGLEAIAVEHNNLLLCLDELHQVDPEVVDQSIYTIANGMSKSRSNKDGSQSQRKKWRLIFLSTGEMGLEEKLSSIHKGVKAGQEIRFLEVPIQRQHGAYDDLYGHNNMNDFSESIWKAVNENHGTVMPQWVEHLSTIDDLPTLLNRNIKTMLAHWEITKENNGNQVIEAAKRFALHGVSGELATLAGLMPWPKGLAEKSAKEAFDAWLEIRGSSSDSEDDKLIKQLPYALKLWRRKLLPEGKFLGDNYGYAIEKDGQLAWFVTRDAFMEGLKVSYRNDISHTIKLMCKNHWLESREGRGTFKKVIAGGPPGGRYFKVLPQQIVADLALDKALSQVYFPT